MWPWQRAQQADLPGERSAGEPAAPVLEPAAPVPGRRPEWPDLPPIQRSVEPMRPVSPQADFGDSLQSWRNPSFLAPLGHVVSADAPSGVIHRLIEPVGPSATTSPGPPLEFAAPPARSPARAGVVQRMIAGISPWASRRTSPAAPAPDDGPRAEPLVAEPAAALTLEPSPAPTPATPAPTPEPTSALVAEPTPALVPEPTRAPASDQPVVTPGVPPFRRPDPAPLVQRSAAGTTPITRAPAVAMPFLELPVLAAPASTAETVTESGPEPEPVAANADSSVPTHAASPDAGADGQAPTLGIGVPSPADQPGDERADGSADVSGPRRRAIVAAVETAGRPARLDPVAQRLAGVDPASSTPGTAPAPSDAPGMAGAGPATGVGRSPSTAQRAGGDAGGPAGVSARPDDGRAPAEQTSAVAPQPAPFVQRSSASAAPVESAAQESAPASAHPGVPPAAEGDAGMGPDPAPDAVPTLGIPSSSRTVQRTDDHASAGYSGLPGAGGTPAAQLPVAPARADQVLQRSVARTAHSAPGSTGVSRRLGLGPPLSPDAVTAQRSPAPPAATPPPLVVAPSPTPTGPAPAETSDVAAAAGVGAAAETGVVAETGVAAGADAGSGPVQPTGDVAGIGAGSAGEQIAPLLGQPDSVPVQRDTATDPVPAGPAVQDRSLPHSPPSAQARTPSAEEPAGTPPRPAEPPLPVLRVHESPGFTEPPGPPGPPGRSGPQLPPEPVLDARPVVARLVGDRPVPMLTVPSGPPAPSDSPSHPQPAQIPRMHAEHLPAGRGPAGSDAVGPFLPARPLSAGPTPGPSQSGAGPAPLSVQLASESGQSSRPMRGGHWPAPVVQAARQEPAPATVGWSAPAWSAPAWSAPAPPSAAPLAPAPDVVSAAGAELPVQLAADDDVVTMPGAEAPATGDPAGAVPGGAVPGGAAPAGPAASAGSPDELIKKLFDPLLRRLKTELRLDRERRGMLTDLRH